MKILFLQDRSYFTRYGFEDEGLSYTVCFLEGDYKKSTRNLTKYDLIMSCIYHDVMANHIINKAASVGVKSIFLTDGVFDLANSINNGITSSLNLFPQLPIVTDYICVSSNMSEKLAKYFGKTPLKLLPKFISHTEVTSTKGRSVLITTANSSYFNDEEFQALNRLIVETYKFCIDSGIDVYFRIFDGRIVKELTQKLKLRADLFRNEGGFEESLEGVGAVFTTHSSICVTTATSRVPTCCFLYRSEPTEPIYGWVYFNGLSLEKIYNEMMKASAARLDFQVAAVQGYGSLDLSSLINDVEIERSESKFYEANYAAALDSWLNLNLMYRIRMIYLRVKGFPLVAKLRKILLVR